MFVFVGQGLAPAENKKPQKKTGIKTEEEMKATETQTIDGIALAAVKARLAETSKQLGKTFTYDEFLAMIYTSVNNIDYYIETCTKYNNGVLMDLTPYWHNMGTGAIDAWRLLMQIEGTPCLPVQKGTETKIALDQFFSPASSHLTFTKIEVSDQARETLGIVGDPYVKYGKLFIRCDKEGSAKISTTAERTAYTPSEISMPVLTRLENSSLSSFTLPIK